MVGFFKFCIVRFRNQPEFCRPFISVKNLQKEEKNFPLCTPKILPLCAQERASIPLVVKLDKYKRE
jgi:hypothetical protein